MYPALCVFVVNQKAWRRDKDAATAITTGLFWSRLHFLIRFLGVTGLLVGCVGLVLAALDDKPLWQAPGLAAWLVLGAAAVAIPAALVELFAGMRAASAGRSLFGLNAVVQIVLAAVLLIKASTSSPSGTRCASTGRARGNSRSPADRADRSAPPQRRNQPVVIYQRQLHRRHGPRRQDGPRLRLRRRSRKVVEKVKDLVQQLRELGPHFRVETLDVEEEGYDSAPTSSTS